jgi:hypothetical protein
LPFWSRERLSAAEYVRSREPQRRCVTAKAWRATLPDCIGANIHRVRNIRV